MLALSALAEPTRCRIVELLAEHGRLPARQISRRFPISPAAISQHLKILKAAKLVRVEVKAQSRIYSLNPDGIDEIEQWVAKLKQLWVQRFDALDNLLNEETE